MTCFSPSFLACTCVFLAMLSPGCTEYQRPTEMVMSSGVQYLAQGQHVLAAEEFQIVTERWPGEWEAQLALGQCYLEMDRLTDARSSLTNAIANRPVSEDIADALAEVYFREGSTQHLFVFLRERTTGYSSVHSWLRLATYSIKCNDPDLARSAVNTAIEMDEGRGTDPYLVAADLAASIGDLELAVRRLSQAYGIDPGNPVIADRLRDLGEVPGPTISQPPGI